MRRAAPVGSRLGAVGVRVVAVGAVVLPSVAARPRGLALGVGRFWAGAVAVAVRRRALARGSLRVLVAAAHGLALLCVSVLGAPGVWVPRRCERRCRAPVAPACLPRRAVRRGAPGRPRRVLARLSRARAVSPGCAAPPVSPVAPAVARAVRFRPPALRVGASPRLPPGVARARLSACRRLPRASRAALRALGCRAPAARLRCPRRARAFCAVRSPVSSSRAPSAAPSPPSPACPPPAFALPFRPPPPRLALSFAPGCRPPSAPPSAPPPPPPASAPRLSPSPPAPSQPAPQPPNTRPPRPCPLPPPPPLPSPPSCLHPTRRIGVPFASLAPRQQI